jgi:hypothetical protein
VNLDNLTPRAKKIALVVLLAVTVIAITVLFIVFAPKGTNPYGNEVLIKGYNNTVKNLSDNYEKLIMAELYKVIRLNAKEGDSVPSVKDATLRDGSAQQEYSEEFSIYKGSFIVDIESLKQSYIVTYTYSRDPNSTALGGYPVLVSCLPAEQLKYGDFSCKDIETEESADLNPITTVLPYSTLTYSIRAVNNDDGSVRLVVTLSITEADRRSGEAAAVAAYKEEVLSWISSQGFNPADYDIVYDY